MSFSHKHLLSIDQLSKQDIETVVYKASDFEKRFKSNDKKLREILSGKILATPFYEPSTRTRLSFETAMLRLGGTIINNPNMKEFSSAKKGETLSDTAQMISRFADIIAIRHPEAHSIEEFSKGSIVPVMNAGDGPHEHPSQALLDCYSIYKEKGKLDDNTIAFIGDLKFGRTVHSLIKALCNFSNISFILISPVELQVPNYIKKIITKSNNRYKEITEFESEIGNADVIYMTRIQGERFESESEYLKYKGVYIMNKSTLSHLKQDAIILHPLPRVDEISPDVDSDPRAKYFEQVENGVYTRMAILSLFLKTKQ